MCRCLRHTNLSPRCFGWRHLFFAHICMTLMCEDVGNITLYCIVLYCKEVTEKDYVNDLLG